MTKALPHRLRDGRCRDCGMLEFSSAPATCCRCALELMAELGYQVIEEDPVRLFEQHLLELWRQPAADMRNNIIKADRFQVYVGHNDGGSLVRPIDDVIPGAWQLATRPAAQRLAQDLLARYPQVWVVTTVGSWNAVKTVPRQRA